VSNVKVLIYNVTLSLCLQLVILFAR